MFDKYGFILKVSELGDNIPDYTETMSNDEFNYNRGYIEALLHVTDIFNEFNI